MFLGKYLLFRELVLTRSSERILIAQICSITTPYLIDEEVWKEVLNCKISLGVDQAMIMKDENMA